METFILINLINFM